MDYKFYENKEKRTICCKMSKNELALALYNEISKCYVDTFLGSLFWYSDRPSFEDFVKWAEKKGVKFEDIEGRAVCSENDEYDYKTGKTIAYKKAAKKYSQKREKVYGVFIRDAMYTAYKLQLKDGRKYPKALDNFFDYR